MGTIYLHRNKVNGKGYVGKTICSTKNINIGRWQNSFGYRGQPVFWRAISKWGWESFDHIILKENINTEEELNYWEKYYIKELHTYIRDSNCCGYNATPGGESTSKYTWDIMEDSWLIANYIKELPRKELYERFIKEFPTNCHTEQAFYGRLKTLRLSTQDNIKFWTDVEVDILIKNFSILPMAELLKLLPGRSETAIWTKSKQLNLHRQVECSEKYSEEELDIIRQYYENFGAEYCRQFLPNRTYQSIKDKACKDLHLRHRIKFTSEAGFNLVKFKQYYNEHTIKDTAQEFNLTEAQVSNIATRHGLYRCKTTIRTTNKPVYCIELNQQFNSVSDASKQLGISKSGISECCSGRRKSANGYHWKFVKIDG